MTDSTIAPTQPTRICTRCKITSDEIQFHPRFSICKPCNDIAREKNRIACARWKAEHPEDYKAAQKRWYDRNSAAKSAYSREYSKNRRATDPEWHKETNGRANKRSKRLWETDSEFRRKGTEYSFRYNYGIGLEDVEIMRQAQNSQCALCKIAGKRLVVDHNHATGKVRALLCDKCNHGLGCFADSIENLQQAIDYLLQHQDM